MGKGTQSAGEGRSYRRVVGLAASVLLVTLSGLIRPVVAQESGNQAGLVVQFGDGNLYTACVDLGPDGEATGEEVLRASGLATVIDYSSGYGGGTVCKIGSQGCNFPAEACFCQCTMKPGDPCIYWTYFHQREGQWRYSNVGGSSYAVRPGDVEGWVWGLGGVGAGVQPPLLSFQQICSAPALVTPPPPKPESSTSTATRIPLPTFTAAVPQPTTTFLPTNTPLPSPTFLSTALPPPTNTLVPTTPVSSPKPGPTAIATVQPSSTPSTTPTAEGAGQPMGAQSGSPLDAQSGWPLAVQSDRVTRPQPTFPAMQTPTLGLLASTAENEQIASGSNEQPPPQYGRDDPAPTVPIQEAESAKQTSNYLLFGVLAVVLMGGLIFLRSR